MKTAFNLTISNPCAERWNEFTPTSTGGFCSSCQKNVIDFTNMSDSQVVAYFRDLANEKQHLCGRFRSDQLGKDYDIKEWFPEWQIKDEVLSYEVPVSKTGQHILLPGIQKMKIVRTLTMAVLTFAGVSYGYGQQKLIGQVVDEQGLPLPGVNIVVKGTTRGVASDKDGKYVLTVNKNDTLVYSFIGFKHNELKATEVKPVVEMKEDATELDEIIVVGYNSTKCTTVTMGGITADYYKKEEPDTNTQNLVSFDKKQSRNIKRQGKVSYNQEVYFQKCKTELRVLGNPVIADEVTIVPKIDEQTSFMTSEEKALTENWYTQHAFQYIDNVQVYDVTGRAFETTYTKINDGRVVINLRNVPSGVCIIRITYSNEQSLNDLESSAVRVLVQR